MNRMNHKLLATLSKMEIMPCPFLSELIPLYQKIVGPFQDAGNTMLAHYLELLAEAGMLTVFENFATYKIHERSSSPNPQVLNTALGTV